MLLGHRLHGRPSWTSERAGRTRVPSFNAPRQAGAAAEAVAPELSKERVRQIGKRASRLMAELAAVHPRFQVMADTLTTVPAPAQPTRRPAPMQVVASNSQSAPEQASAPSGALQRKDLAA